MGDYNQERDANDDRTGDDPIGHRYWLGCYIGQKEGHEFDTLVFQINGPSTFDLVGHLSLLKVAEVRRQTCSQRAAIKPGKMQGAG